MTSGLKKCCLWLGCHSICSAIGKLEHSLNQDLWYNSNQIERRFRWLNAGNSHPSSRLKLLLRYLPVQVHKRSFVGDITSAKSNYQSGNTSFLTTQRLSLNPLTLPSVGDGRGRVFDNIFIERLWRSVKYEEVYLNDYDSVNTACRRLRDYFNFYNQERFHQSLNYLTPHEVYYQ